MADATPPPGIDLHDHATWRRTKSNIAVGLMGVALLLVALPLALVIYTVVKRGIGVISWDFLTGPIGPQISPEGGMGPAVAGTLMITGMATLMAVPLGVLGAVYLNEYGRKGPLAQLVRFMSYVMTGVPSIVMMKSRTPRPISADRCIPDASPNSFAITAGIELPGANRCDVIWAEDPITSAAAIVSPIARPSPSMTAPTTPPLLCGQTAPVIISSLVAPSA